MADELAALRNLGPKSQAMLAAAGITTSDELRRLGSVAAYARVNLFSSVDSSGTTRNGDLIRVLAEWVESPNG